MMDKRLERILSRMTSGTMGGQSRVASQADTNQLLKPIIQIITPSIACLPFEILHTFSIETNNFDDLAWFRTDDSYLGRRNNFVMSPDGSVVGDIQIDRDWYNVPVTFPPVIHHHYLRFYDTNTSELLATERGIRAAIDASGNRYWLTRYEDWNYAFTYERTEVSPFGYIVWRNGVQIDSLPGGSKTANQPGSYDPTTNLIERDGVLWVAMTVPHNGEYEGNSLLFALNSTTGEHLAEFIIPDPTWTGTFPGDHVQNGAYIGPGYPAYGGVFSVESMASSYVSDPGAIWMSSAYGDGLYRFTVEGMTFYDSTLTGNTPTYHNGLQAINYAMQMNISGYLLAGGVVVSTFMPPNAAVNNQCLSDQIDSFLERFNEFPELPRSLDFTDNEFQFDVLVSTQPQNLALVLLDITDSPINNTNTVDIELRTETYWVVKFFTEYET